MTKAKQVISTKRVIASDRPVQPAVNYIGQRFVAEGRTFEIWKYTQPLSPHDPGEYDAVALIDPTKGIETVPYTTIERSVAGKKESIPLHRLGNVDPNTHISIPADQVRRVLLNPEILVLKTKKVIQMKRPAQVQAA